MSAPKDASNLYLVGFMGTGKSAVGRTLAQELGMTYLDSDAAIEQEQGRRISEIFEAEGEPAFRALERRFIEEGHPGAGCIVSCGGGLVTQPGMIEALQARGTVVCLMASPETIHERTKHSKHRPLLQVEDPLARIRELLAEREPWYEKAGIAVLTDGRSIREISEHVLRVYQREGEG